MLITGEEGYPLIGEGTTASSRFEPAPYVLGIAAKVPAHQRRAITRRQRLAARPLRLSGLH